MDNINVGTATASAEYLGANNYAPSVGSATFEIEKIDPVCSVDPYNVPYNGSPHTATGSCQGILVKPSADWIFQEQPIPMPEITHPTRGPSRTAPATITMLPEQCMTSFKRSTPPALWSAGLVPTTAAARSLWLLHRSWRGNPDGLDLGASFIDVPGGTAFWIFAGGPNYNDQSGSVAMVIEPIDATCTIVGWTGPYDGNPHGATGSCTGLGAAILSGLDLGETFTNVPGGTAFWTFDGSPNYNNQNGSVAIVIEPIDATCSIVGWTGTYDAQPHGASGSCTGVGGAVSSGLDLGETFTNVPGGTANWSFNGSPNYNNQTGSVPIVIEKADPVCTFRPYDVPYDTTAHTATGDCLGVQGEILPGLDLTQTTHVNAGITPIHGPIPTSPATTTMPQGPLTTSSARSMPTVLSMAGPAIMTVCPTKLPATVPAWPT